MSNIDARSESTVIDSSPRPTDMKLEVVFADLEAGLSIPQFRPIDI